MTKAEQPTVDLLGDAVMPGKRVNAAPEQAALHEVLLALRNHPSVSWVERQNTGSLKVGNRFVRFGWPGCSDLIGMMRDGRFIACEVKSATGKLRPEQAIFLARVSESGGVGFVAKNCNDVIKTLSNK